MHWVREVNPSEHASAITKTLLLQMSVPFDDARIREDLERAYNYPSLASIAGALEGWKIEAEGLAVQDAYLDQIPVPFIAVQKGQRFCVVTRLSKDRVELIDTVLGPAARSREEFAHGFHGVVLTAKPHEGAAARAREGDDRGVRRIRAGVAGAAGLGLVGLLSATVSATTAGWLVLAVAGCVLSALLVSVELGAGTLIRRICSGTKGASCESVLTSKAAKIGPVGMADIGVTYFAATTLVLVVSSFFASDTLVVGALAWAAYLAIPYTLFSLAYQAFVIKVYCPLCIAVQGLLWLQAGWAWTRVGLPSLTIDRASGTLLFVGFIGTAVVWSFVAPLVRRSHLLPQIESKLARLERNPAVVMALLNESEQTSLPAVPVEIIEGAEKPLVIITVYTASFCAHCSRAHGELETLLAELGTVLQVRYRLLASKEKHPSPDRNAVGHIVAALAAGEKEKAARTLAAWFTARRERRTLELPAIELDGAAAELFDRHTSFTWPMPGVPAIFVGPKKLPDTIEIANLRAFVLKLREAAGR